MTYRIRKTMNVKQTRAHYGKYVKEIRKLKKKKAINLPPTLISYQVFSILPFSLSYV